MLKKADDYRSLKEFSKELQIYTSISHLLYWDRETYMPEGGSVSRSIQFAQLSGLIHELKTGKKFKELLQKVINLSTGRISSSFSRLEKLVIQRLYDDYKRQSKIPTPFVKKFSQITSEASQVWAIAKKTNDFPLFAPYLEKIVALNREKAETLGFTKHPYDALLELYEPCMSTRKMKHIFDKLRKELVSLLQSIQQARPIDDRMLWGRFNDQKQHKLGSELMAILPIDKRYIRLDLSAHPFSTSLHPHDNRITTRILPNGFLSNLFSILHEAGHSMYEMGLPADHWGTALAEATSLSIHESQSRWWETLIGRSLGFWSYFYPKVQKTFPSKFAKVSLDQFYHTIHKISPSFIRVEADEVTYCLHVILRFELEMALISGDLSVADLPHAWREKMKDLLGIIPPTDREGCLQDIHWSLGDFGYFPTYALGNLFAAQFFSAFSKQHPDWESRIQQGDLAFIREWLRTNIHCYGKQYFSDELVKKVTGEPLSEKSYCRYLKNKYSTIYHL